MPVRRPTSVALSPAGSAPIASSTAHTLAATLRAFSAATTGSSTVEFSR
jgi:hypothetical protein